MKRSCWLSVVVLLALQGAGFSVAWALTPLPMSEPALSKELARAQAGKKAVLAEAAQKRLACQQRFAVNDCVRKVEQDQRQQLRNVREYEQLLKAQQRKLRAQAQAQRVAQRQEQKKTSAPSTLPALVPPAKPPPRPKANGTPPTPVSAQTRQTALAQKAAAQKKKQDERAAQLLERQQRAQQKKAKQNKPPAKGLDLPAATPNPS